MSYVIQLVHIVINTKNRKMTITPEHKQDLYRYIWGIIKNRDCRLYRINGIGNHLHMLVGLHQSISVMEIVRDIKRSSSLWAKDNSKFPSFEGWQKEYAAFSVSWKDKDSVISYIRNQEEHHNTATFDEEHRQLLSEHEIDEYNPQ